MALISSGVAGMAWELTFHWERDPAHLVDVPMRGWRPTGEVRVAARRAAAVSG